LLPLISALVSGEALAMVVQCAQKSQWTLNLGPVQTKLQPAAVGYWL